MLVANAIEGFLLARSDLSPRTLEDYRYYLTLWAKWSGDVAVGAVKLADLQRFMAHMTTDYKTKTGGPLSQHGLYNCYVALRAFWRWAEDSFGYPNISTRVSAPRVADVAVKPLTSDECLALLNACKYKTQARPENKRAYRARRAEGKRDTAMVLLLLDTGIRAGELARLAVGDVDLRNREIQIRPHGSGVKSRGRVIPIVQRTASALWAYINQRAESEEEVLDADRPLFVSLRTPHRPIGRNALQHVLVGLGKRAGVENVHPHRFRHTFAIEYLRNGGDPWTLQRILGHSTMEMVRRYLALSKQDEKRTHRNASPVVRMGL